MQTEWIIAMLAAVCVVFFLISKKNPAGKMKPEYNKDDSAVRDFRFELETVAEMAVKKIEEKISRLDYLIEDAQEKSNQLDTKIKLVNNVIEQFEEMKADALLASQNDRHRLKKEDVPLPVKSLPPKSLQSKKLPLKLGTIGFTETVRKKNSTSIWGGTGHKRMEMDLLNNEKHRVALTMLREGYNVLDIAKVTGLGKGEIILLQGLRDRKK